MCFGVQVSPRIGAILSLQPVSTSRNDEGRRHLRSAARGQLQVPRPRLSTYGKRAFAYAAINLGTIYQTI